MPPLRPPLAGPRSSCAAARGRRTAQARQLLPAAAALLLCACSTASAVRIAGAAVGAALESAGLKSPATPPTTRPLSLTITATERANASDEGKGLSVVLRLYRLRDPTAFGALGYTRLAAPDHGGAELGTDLLASRELTLLPGRGQRFEENWPLEAGFAGVVVLFRHPAAQGWRTSFDLRDAANAEIAIEVRDCRLVVLRGRPLPPPPPPQDAAGPCRPSDQGTRRL